MSNLLPEALAQPVGPWAELPRQALVDEPLSLPLSNDTWTFVPQKLLVSLFTLNLVSVFLVPRKYILDVPT